MDEDTCYHVIIVPSHESNCDLHLAHLYELLFG